MNKTDKIIELKELLDSGRISIVQLKIQVNLLTRKVKNTVTKLM